MPFCPAYDAAGGNEFGWRVAVEGDTVVVASWHDDDDGTDCGLAYVFTEPNTRWTEATETTRLTASGAAGGDQFGASVVVVGDTVVTGAHLDDANGADSGSVYVYPVSDLTGVPTWTEIPNSAAGETNATSYTVTVLTNDVGYSFRIRATNGGGTSPVSDAGAVTPAS